MDSIPSSAPSPSITLSDEIRGRIRAEEIFREEVRRSFTATPTSRSARVWAWLNSSFAIFLLSSVVLGTISWQYQYWTSERQRTVDLERLRQEASVELGYRFFLMIEILKKSDAKGRDAHVVAAMFFGQEPYTPAVARFKNASVPAVLYLLRAEKLQDVLEKIIIDAMPKIAASLQSLSSYKDDQPLDEKTRRELHDTMLKVKLLSLKW